MRNQEENAIQLQIIRYLKGKGYYVGKIKTKGSSIYDKRARSIKYILDIYQATGLPDLIVFTPKLIFLEVKTPETINKKNGGLSDNQVEFQRLCVGAGVSYYVVRSLEDVIKITEEKNE